MFYLFHSVSEEEEEEEELNLMYYFNLCELKLKGWFLL